MNLRHIRCIIVLLKGDAASLAAAGPHVGPEASREFRLFAVKALSWRAIDLGSTTFRW